MYFQRLYVTLMSSISMSISTIFFVQENAGGSETSKNLQNFNNKVERWTWTNFDGLIGVLLKSVTVVRLTPTA